MNLAKARDYFSAYYDSTLDRGLKQSFETRLKEDAQLQAEYKAFERTMQSLEALGQINVEPPADLHEKISARLDRAIWEQKREKSNGFSLNLRWALGLTGAVAIAVLLVFGVKNQMSANSASMFGGGSAEAPRFVFAAQNRAITLSFAQVNHETILLRDISGKVLRNFALDREGLSSYPISNDAPNAQLVSVETADQSVPTSFVALPGKVQDRNTSGKGSVADFALALAGHYQHPVVLQVGELAQQDASWDISGGDPMGAARSSLRQLNLAVSQDASGYISITKS